ncbi:MAG: hypothetical protein BA066_05045 [Candidatus Korarchaeota archaeon NZ13-K]|nr:MAG: hypothetical protein BA066_05045 [Candidatus Korarchaeota archaeon NZ13-K]
MIRILIWLHLLRLWRLRYSFLNMVVSNAMWVLLLILGVLLFVPRGELDMALRSAYWTIACWSVISNFSSLVGGWSNFFISIGMVEEHLMRGISPFYVIGGRLIVATIVSSLTIALMGILVGALFSVDMFSLLSPELALLGFTVVSLESLLYGLTISALAMRTSVSEQFLEILNFSTVGVLIVPTRVIPENMRLVYLAIPYVAPAYLLKVSAGSESGSLIGFAVLISILETLILLSLTIMTMRSVERYLRRNGVRAIGFY